MTDTKIYAEAVRKLVVEKDFLFTDNQAIPFGEYLDYFANKVNEGQPFYYYVSPGVYKLDVLDQYKDNVVFTNYMAMQQGGRQLYSVIQVSPEAHIQVVYYFQDKKFAVGLDFFCKHSKFFTDFVTNNSAFEDHGPEKSAGFGGGTAGFGMLPKN